MNDWQPPKSQGILAGALARTQSKAIIPVEPSPPQEVIETDPDRLLAAISDLSALIEQSTDIGETVALRNRAQAIQFLSRKVELETEIKNRATIAVINAKRKIGELTMELPQSDPFSHNENKGKTELLEQYGLDHNEVYRNETLAKLDRKRLSLFLDKKLSQGYEITVGAAMKYAQHVAKTKPTDAKPAATRRVIYGTPGVNTMELVIPDEISWMDEYYDFARNLLPDDVRTGEVWDIEARRRE